MDRDRVHAHGLRANRAPIGKLIVQHEHAVAKAELRIHHLLTVVGLHDFDNLGAKGPLVELDRFGRVMDNNIGG